MTPLEICYDILTKQLGCPREKGLLAQKKIAEAFCVNKDYHRMSTVFDCKKLRNCWEFVIMKQYGVL